jgi:hypothetical protein
MKYDKIKELIAESKIMSVKTDDHGRVTSKSYGDDTPHKPTKSNGLKPGTDKAGVSKARELARRAIAQMVKEEQDIDLSEEQLDEITEAAMSASEKYDSFVGKQITHKGYKVSQEGPKQWAVPDASKKRFSTLDAVKRHIDKNL